MCKQGSAAKDAASPALGASAAEGARPRRWRRVGVGLSVLVAAFAALLPGSLPQPTDAHGQAVLRGAVVLRIYWQVALHALGLRPGPPDGPEVAAPLLEAAPPTWTLEPLPELHAGVDFSTREELLTAFEPFRNQRPVVLRGFLTHEKSAVWAGSLIRMTQPWWDVQHLKDVFGAAEVRIFDNYTTDDSIRWMKFSDYADDVMNNPQSIRYGRAMTEQWDVRPDMTEAVDVKVLSDLAGRPWPWKGALDAFHAWGGAAAMFVSGQRPTTKLHADLGESFVVHTEGRKLWRFFGPEALPLLTPVAMIKNLGFKVPFDIFAPDFQARPWLRLARGWESEIATGDLLYFPTQTWHGVKNLGERNVIIDVGFFDILRSFRRAWPLTLSLLLHPSPPMDALRFCFLGSASYDGHALPNGTCMKEVYFQTYGNHEPQWQEGEKEAS